MFLAVCRGLLAVPSVRGSSAIEITSVHRNLAVERAREGRRDGQLDRAEADIAAGTARRRENAQVASVLRPMLAWLCLMDADSSTELRAPPPRPSTWRGGPPHPAAPQLVRCQFGHFQMASSVAPGRHVIDPISSSGTPNARSDGRFRLSSVDSSFSPRQLQVVAQRDVAQGRLRGRRGRSSWVSCVGHSEQFDSTCSVCSPSPGRHCGWAVTSPPITGTMPGSPPVPAVVLRCLIAKKSQIRHNI